MKYTRSIAVLGFVLLYFATIQAQNYPHIPFTTSHEHQAGGTGNCLGWAMNKAFAYKADNSFSSTCDAYSLYIDETKDISFYFQPYTGSVQELLNGVQVGDMLRFPGPHYVYIYEKNGTAADEIKCTAVENDGGAQTSGTVDDVIKGKSEKNIQQRGNPVSYWRLKRNRSLKSRIIFMTNRIAVDR